MSPPTETDEKPVHQSVAITDPNHPIGCCPHRPKPMKTRPPISRHHRPKSPYRLLSSPTETDEKPSTNQSSSPTQSPYRLLSSPTETDEKPVHQSVVITDPNHPIGCCLHRPKPMKNQSTNQSSSPTQITLSVAVSTDRNR